MLLVFAASTLFSAKTFMASPVMPASMALSEEAESEEESEEESPAAASMPPPPWRS